MPPPAEHAGDRRAERLAALPQPPLDHRRLVERVPQLAERAPLLGRHPCPPRERVQQPAPARQPGGHAHAGAEEQREFAAQRQPGEALGLGLVGVGQVGRPPGQPRPLGLRGSVDRRVLAHQRHVEPAAAGERAAGERAEPRQKLLHHLAGARRRPAEPGADDRQRQQRAGAAEQRRRAGVGDRGRGGVEERLSPLGVPRHRPVAAADPREPRAGAVRRRVEERLRPRAVVGERAALARPVVLRVEPLVPGAGAAAGRDQPGVAGELPQVAADDEHVAGHRVPPCAALAPPTRTV